MGICEKAQKEIAFFVYFMYLLFCCFVLKLQ